jgi:GTP-binding protein HflX
LHGHDRPRRVPIPRPPGGSPIYDPRQDLRPERALLVGFAGRRPLTEVRASLDELARLADTAGCRVVGELLQKRGTPNPATLLSKGKLEELRGLAASTSADTVLFDDDLTPAQVRNLEKALDRKVVDRSEVILSIFAKHARTRESRLQVEVAQLEYSLPRLRHMWQHLERLGGGIGTRGPGESQLETDRRLARDRVALLKRQLALVEKERRVQRQARANEFRVAIVGYTNAGKSTLFNALTHANVRAEDRLFATLDATTRRMVNEKREVLLVTDTVGFIRKLPHHLVASFRSTLAEVIEADLWLHVVDASDPSLRDQIRNVEQVLASLEGGEGFKDAPGTFEDDGERPAVAHPTLLAFNKIDALGDEALLYGLPLEFPGSLRVSALTGEGLADLRARLWELRRGRRAAAAAAAKTRAATGRRARERADSGLG